MTHWPYVILIFVAFAGFLLASHIFRKKRVKQPMVCPLNSNCEAVINSRFSTLLGIPLEIIGMLYYAITALSYGLFLILPNIITTQLTFITLVITTFAFLFSLYLTFIQAFAIKEWCVWCLTSAFFCTIIFTMTLLGSNYELSTILIDNTNLTISAGFLALAIGLGSITIYDILFLKFLKDLKISQTENDILNLISQVIWLAIFLFLLTLIGLTPLLNTTIHPNQLIMAILALIIIMINEIILNIFVAPKLVSISFGKTHVHIVGELHHLRKLSFVIATTSLFSWYAILALVFITPNLINNLDRLILYYLAILGLGLVVGIVAEKLINGRHRPKINQV